MSTKTVTQPKSAPVVPIAKKKDVGPELLQHYCGDAIQFAGTADALYDRHLIFDRAIDPKVASAGNALKHSRTQCVMSWRSAG